MKTDWNNARPGDTIGKEQSKHTPGPWKVESGSWPRVICRSGDKNDGATIAEVYNGHPNAYLIAAAPDLLEACKIAFANLKPAYSSEHLVMRLLSAAIQKAEGAL